MAARSPRASLRRPRRRGTHTTPPPPSRRPWPTIGACGFPLDPDRPLVFHTLTEVSGGGGATDFMEQLVDENALLAPSEKRTEDWSLGESSDLQNQDIDSGDTRWCFYSVAKPYRGMRCHIDRPEVKTEDWTSGREERLDEYRVSLAFEPETLFAAGNVGWRPHDLLRVFEEVDDRYGPR